MSTQGLLSIVHNGRTKAKIVAGCNGGNIQRLAAHLRKKPTTEPAELLKLCREFGVCCDRCLIIQLSPIDFVLPEGEDFEPGPDLDRWKRTFEDPRFNPRWEQGTAAFTEIVDINLCQEKYPPQPKSKSSPSGHKIT